MPNENLQREHMRRLIEEKNKSDGHLAPDLHNLEAAKHVASSILVQTQAVMVEFDCGPYSGKGQR